MKQRISKNNVQNAGLAVAAPQRERARCQMLVLLLRSSVYILAAAPITLFPFRPRHCLLCRVACRDCKNKHNVWLHPTFHRCQEDHSEGENSQHLQDQHGEGGREERIIFTVTSPSVPGSLILLPPSLHTSLPMSHFHHLFFSVLPSFPPTLRLCIFCHDHTPLSLIPSLFLHLYLTSRLPHSGCQAPFVLFEALNSSFSVLCISPEK